MPRSFGERLFAALGVAVVLVLVGIALTRGADDDGQTAGPPPADTTPPPVTTTTTETRRRPPPPPPIPPPPSAGSAVLVVKATRGPSLVSIRVESEEGESLHEGFVSRGQTVRASADRLWIRLGSASNVDLTLNGRPVERLREGRIDLLASADSIQVAN
jgi:hypothetical protein